MTQPSQPRFTIISAVYDVARYLPEFIASIEGQDFDLSRVEVLMIDDGSTDGSNAVLTAWAERRPELVRVIRQENAGQGPARNVGISEARGEWVTFPDPDDAIGREYLSSVEEFLTRNPSAHMVGTNRLMWSEADGTITNTHPLRRFFNLTRLVDLERDEITFHGAVNCAFFRLDLLREFGVLFDKRIRPNFEDGHFCSVYLLHVERPVVGFVKGAHYHYRRRADLSSTLQLSTVQAARYTDVFEHGYLGILDEAERLRGTIPLWLQHFVCYELIGYIRVYGRGQAQIIHSGPIADAFHSRMGEVAGRLDLAEVLDNLDFGVLEQYRLALKWGYSDERWVEDRVCMDLYSPGQRLARVRYRFTGEVPAEIVQNGDELAGPRHAKTVDHTFYGRTLIRERILWVRYHPDLRISVDGRWRQVEFERSLPQFSRIGPARIRRRTGPIPIREQDRVATLKPPPASPWRRLLSAPRKRRLAKRFAGAWVLMDRVHNAGDGGEVLFRHLRTKHPDINAWFTVEKDTSDWTRLRSEFGSRVVAHGSSEWLVLMANCLNLLSSHADHPVIRPHAFVERQEPQWRFVFLQHGVIKDDLSPWLGPKPIDLFVVSTPAELASIAGDGSRYPFTTKEVQLTGLPRFDRLLSVGERFGPDQRDLILIAPTWREWLVDNLEQGSQRRTLPQGVLDSEFVQSWLAVLGAPELAALCARTGLRIGFLPHPNMQLLLDQIRLPDHVEALRYEGTDVQEYFARARVTVTDYSSIAFNSAYLDRPTVYYQFDAEQVRNGGHVGRPGYFEYERDGFGPVTATHAEVIAAIVDAVDGGPDPQSPYAERIAATFPDRDGGCSERVVQAVLALDLRDTGPGQVPTPVAGVSAEVHPEHAARLG
ncbi:MAG: hypothetical protein JWP74_3404 [Marmoricola sp.]|nr:hypothetical protein [Marmoricola sp.]